jgi:hypothetical protein
LAGSVHYRHRNDLDRYRLMAENAAVTAPSLKAPAPSVGRLDSLCRVRREAAKLYAAARKGEVPSADAARMGSILSLIGTLIERGALEACIGALEARL